MRLSIIIPVYNEENTIEQIIRKVEAVSLSIEKEIIVVNDGSFDNTRKIIEILKKQFNFNLIEHKKNQGKGAAIRTGLSKVSGDFVIIQDADLEYEPKEYQILIAPLLEAKAEVVYGSRMLKRNKIGYPSFYLGGKFLTFITNLLYGLKITDEATCYKVFKTDVLKSLNLESQGFEFCPEVTAKIARKGIKIYEVPISYNPRFKKEGKKINWKDGLIAVWTLIKYKFR